MQELCQGCLAGDRKLTPLIDFVDIFHYLEKTIPQETCTIKPLLCWECNKMLFNLHKFQQRVLQAQEVLKKLGSISNIKCLSSLKTISIIDHYDFMHTFDIFDDSVKEEATETDSYVDDSLVLKEEATETDSYVDDSLVLKEEATETDSYVDDSKVHLPKFYLEKDYDADNKLKIENFDDYPDDVTNIKYEYLAEALEEIKVKTQESEDNDFLSEDESTKFKETLKKSGVKHGHAKKGAYGNYQIVPIEPKVIDGKMFKLINIDLKEAKELFIAITNKPCRQLKSNKLKCRHCRKPFSSQIYLKKHIRIYHTESYGKYSCDICGRRLISKRRTVVHVQAHFRKYQCYTCKEICSSKKNVTAHLQSHNKEIKCKLCGLGFGKFDQFKKHYREMHQRVYCDYCGYSVINKKRLITHILYNHIDSHKCLECGKVFNKRTWLNNHQIKYHKTSGDPMDAYCVECDMYFKNANILNRHLKNSAKHRTSVKQYPCIECNKVYTKSSYMKNHYKFTHLRCTNYYCNMCREYFLNSTTLKRHARAKHGKGDEIKKKHICPHCGRGFSVKRVLMNHIRTHTGEKPYVCDFCPAAFAQKYPCTLHMKKLHHADMRRKATT